MVRFRLTVLAAISSMLALATPSLALQRVAVLTAAQSEGTQVATAEDALKAKLADPKAVVADKKIRAALQAYYETHGFGLIWIDDGAVLPKAKRLIERLAASRLDGFEPRDYQRASIADVAPGANFDQLAKADLDLSAALLLYARHAVSGRVEAARLDAQLSPKRTEIDLVGTLAALASLPDPVAFLEALHPTHPGFLALKAELARDLGAADTQTQQPANIVIPAGPPLKLGMSDARVPLLRQRFALEAAPEQDKAVMDGALVAALRQFQQSRNIPINGVLNAQTVRVLNGDVPQSGKERLAQILINMERWRWLPRDLGTHRVMVSVPEYLVRVMDEDKTAYEGRVVVGAEKTPTPIFSATMEYLVVNPSWNVPPGILKNEILPLYRKNPSAVARLGLQVTQTRHGISFRQPPGERNALGRVKFMFPNDYSVYLHDTPARSYFLRDKRAFSHGCVRVDTPMRFADVLLSAEKALNSKKLESMFGSSERYVKLAQKVPVHITYFTLAARADGTIARFDDVYGLDGKMKVALGL